jgi:hypothetical protein
MFAPVLLTDTLLKMRAHDLESEASRNRRAGRSHRAPRAEGLSGAVSIRAARPADAAAVASLARLDGHAPLRGTVMVAELDGALVAARSLDDGTAVADPFSASAGPAALLRLRSEQVRGAGHLRGRRLGPRLLRRTA